MSANRDALRIRTARGGLRIRALAARDARLLNGQMPANGANLAPCLAAGTVQHSAPTTERTERTERLYRVEVMSEPKHNAQRCQLCGRSDCPGHDPAEIPILKGHVRRAIRAADAVCAAAVSDDGPEPGVVLMTALLLVERLATAQGCEPAAVLQKMADSFETKRRATATLSHSN